MIFGDDDRENEEFLGFDLDNIEEAEERYIRQLDVLNDFDSDIKFSEIDRRTTRKLTAMTILFSPTLLNGGTRLLWRITNEKYIF